MSKDLTNSPITVNNSEILIYQAPEGGCPEIPDNHPAWRHRIVVLNKERIPYGAAE